MDQKEMLETMLRLRDGGADPDTARREALAELRTIPGVGARVAADLYDLGYRSVAELADKDPQKIYDALCKRAGCRVNRCMLYVFRSITYYASTENPDPELLDWWKWQDAKNDDDGLESDA